MKLKHVIEWFERNLATIQIIIALSIIPLSLLWVKISPESSLRFSKWYFFQEGQYKILMYLFIFTFLPLSLLCIIAMIKSIPSGNVKFKSMEEIKNPPFSFIECIAIFSFLFFIIYIAYFLKLYYPDDRYVSATFFGLIMFALSKLFWVLFKVQRKIDINIVGTYGKMDIKKWEFNIKTWELLISYFPNMKKSRKLRDNLLLLLLDKNQ